MTYYSEARDLRLHATHSKLTEEERADVLNILAEAFKACQAGLTSIQIPEDKLTPNQRMMFKCLGFDLKLEMGTVWSQDPVTVWILDWETIK